MKVSLVSLIVLSMVFGTTIYRTPLKTLTILSPLIVLGLLMLWAREINDFRFAKSRPVIWLALITVITVLWMPLTPIIGQNPASPYKNNFFVYTMLNFVPFLFCVGVFVYSASVYALSDTKRSKFLFFLLLVMVFLLTAFYVNVNKSVFNSLVNGNWFSMFLFQVYVIRLLIMKKNKVSFCDVLFAFFLAIFTWVFLGSRTIFAAYFIFLATYWYLTSFQKKRWLVAPLMALGLCVSLWFTLEIAYLIYSYGDSDIFSLAGKDGKHLLNGRELAWGYMWEQFQNYFWFGRGTGYLTVSEYVGDEFTLAAVHNAWLDFGVKFGILGVVMLFLFLVSYWHSLTRQISNIRVRLVAAYAITSIAFLTVYNTYGFSHFGLQLGTWFILGVGLGRVTFLSLRQNVRV